MLTIKCFFLFFVDDIDNIVTVSLAEMTTTSTKKLIDELSAIRGIKGYKAMKLISAGVRSVADLNKDKYWDMLPIESQLEIKYPIEEKYTWGFADKLMSMMPSWMIPVGSYRRGKPKLKDLDLLTLKPIDTTIDKLRKLEKEGKFKIVEVYSHGGNRVSLVLRFKSKWIHMDIFKTTKEELPFALFHWTGSKGFNIRTRAHAKRQGYKLNQHGLYDIKTGRLHMFPTERKLFDFLSITYKRPIDRSE